MNKFRINSASEQVAAHLRQQISRGERVGEMPGIFFLSTELGVNHKTVELAMKQLEKEGLLIDRGPRRARGICKHAVGKERKGRKVAIMRFEADDGKIGSIMEISHALTQAGHFPFYVRKCVTDIGTDVEQLKRYVRKVDTDAWLVIAGTREMLEWFASQPKPTFCLFGKFRDLNIAGARANGTLAYAYLVRKLVELGHRRIVLLARPQRKLPAPGASEQAFLDALTECGIQVSDYHFPLWDNTKKGLHRCLEELFRITPPTAMITDETVLFGAVEQFLAQRRIRVPQDVSLINGVPDPSFAMREISVAHFANDDDLWVRQVLRWASQIHQGKDYRRKLFHEVKYVPGGTVGPAYGGKSIISRGS